MALLDDKIYSEWIQMKKALEKHGFDTVEEFVKGIDKLAVSKAKDTLEAFQDLVMDNYYNADNIKVVKVLEYIEDFKSDLR